MDSETYHLLYQGADGDVIGLDEVQLLDPPPVDRIPRLISLLCDPADWIAYQAGLILSAWGESEGVKFLIRVVEKWPDTGRDFSPQRLHCYDNALDEIAYAAHLFRLSGGDPDLSAGLFRLLLGLYGPVEYESKLKYALLRWDGLELVADVLAAIQRAEHLNKHYLASQLLPPLARWLGASAMPVMEPFTQKKDDPDPKVNVAEALLFVSPELALPILSTLANDRDNVVSAQAQSSLKLLRLDL